MNKIKLCRNQCVKIMFTVNFLKFTNKGNHIKEEWQEVQQEYIKFHSLWGEKNLSESKKMSKFCRRARPLFVQFIFFTLMRKLECLPSTVSVNLSIMALPIVPKVKFIFEIMLYIIIFRYGGTGICFKSVIGNLTWKHTDRLAFAAVEEKGKFFCRKVWWFSIPSSSILRQPKHWLVFFLEVPIKEVVIWLTACHDYTKDEIRNLSFTNLM